MQRLIFVFILGFAATSFGQNNVPAENTNSEPTNSGTVNNGVTNNSGYQFNTINNANSENGNFNALPDSVRTYKYESPAKEEEELKQKESTVKTKKVTETQPRTLFSIGTPAKATAPKTASEDLNLEMDLKEEEKADSPVIQQQVQMQERFEDNQYRSNSQYSRRSASPEEQWNMDASVGYYNAVLPNTFESHFYTYLAGHYNTDLYPELQAAAALQPENTEVKKQQAAYHIITNESDLALPVIKELIDAKVVSQGQLTYANDLLLSGEEATILIMHGFEDMFAVYYMQQNNAVREDVQLLSLDFMQSETYRAGWAAKNLVLPASTVIDTAYLAELCQLNSDKSLQLSMTIPKDYFVPMKNNLYPIGLTFRYSVTPIDNYSVNYSLWKETLKFKLINEASNDSGDKWCPNYLPMLVSLRKQLVLQGNTTEEEAVNKAILKIGEKTNNPDKVKKYIDK
ncbi:MAG: hypothetical protein A3D31_05105 [Candidatus Fluviicola riflensis]|nr:MAG: hypothetical protein CHH17_09910 [Candidatus Fluviicola riflensis]OGS79352.1 MAG: hypothetical protein A3D31_05105 [Candidatus Fluviicola riflensis]OGS86784.1 MAG: hypothetical protein A2724_04565 [Fluviicola sp. RIFCSPHIGHO2_01_FULL_43_53]OGS88743.1 MAG: hypothetical protein A3E30_00095 [Fluviicola sp. RIFCSPHIGHO2_12_FULL_43_24]